MRRLASLAVALALSTSAHAQATDQAGATKVRDSLATYVSQAAFDKGVLKIAPEGDGYKVDIDFKPLLSLIPMTEGAKIDIAPYALTIKERADGSWDVAGPMFPNGSYEALIGTVPMKGSWTIEAGKMTGTFDPALATFSSSEGSFDSMTMRTEAMGDRASQSYGKSEITTVGKAGANGGVDVTLRQTVRNYEEMRQFTVPENGSSFPMTIKSPAIIFDGDTKGVRSKALLDLLAFAVANPQKELAKEKQDQLRQLALNALPLWETLNGIQTMENLSIASPVGTLNAAKVDMALAVDGVREDGKAAIDLKLENVRAASLFMPGWVPQFVPTAVDFKLRAENLDSDQFARKAIAAMDLNQEPPVPEAVRHEIAVEFQASPPVLKMEKSTIRNALSAFSAEGQMTFTDGEPNFLGTVEATDFDKTIEALQTAAKDMPELNDAVLGTQMAKGMAKTLPDGRLQWTLEAKADGSVQINGQMVKGPDPVEPEIAPDAGEPAEPKL